MQSWLELLAHGKPEQDDQKQASHHHEDGYFGGMKAS
jgi:hypothetical protein